MARKKIEVPDLRAYEAEGLAHAFLLVDPRIMQAALTRAAELAREREEADDDDDDDDDDTDDAGLLLLEFLEKMITRRKRRR